MRKYKKFTPDPDYEDHPDGFGIGTFSGDDGDVYGSDPDLAAQILSEQEKQELSDLAAVPAPKFDFSLPTEPASAGTITPEDLAADVAAAGGPQPPSIPGQEVVTPEALAADVAAAGGPSPYVPRVSAPTLGGGSNPAPPPPGMEIAHVTQKNTAGQDDLDAAARAGERSVRRGMESEERAAQAATQGFRAGVEKVQEELYDQQAEQVARAQAARQAKAEADAEIDEIHNKPVQEIDPDQYWNSLDGGARTRAVLSMAFGALGKAGRILAGAPGGENVGLSLFKDAVRRNIEKQKHAIASGKEKDELRLQELQSRGLTAAQAESAAEALQYKLGAKMAEQEAAVLQREGQDAAGVIRIGEALAREADQKVSDLHKDILNQKTVVYAKKNALEPLEAKLKRIQIKEAELSYKRKTEANNTPLVPAPPVISDTNEEDRRRIAAGLNAIPEGQRYKQMETLGTDLKKTIVPTDTALNNIANILGVERNPDGSFPEFKVPTKRLAGLMKAVWDSDSPFKANIPEMTPQEAALRTEFARIRMANRAGWATEPTGAAKQTLFEDFTLPVSNDPEVWKNAFNTMNQTNRVNADALMSSYMPPVVAAIKLQNPRLFGYGERSFAPNVKGGYGLDSQGRKPPPARKR